jgi:hypothetical protein
MPSDTEYLEQAGLTESGDPVGSPSQGSETPSVTPQTAEPTAAEMFELQGHKFPVSTEFQLVQDGKTQKVPYNSLLNGYRRATHYQQKHEEFLKQQKEWEEKLKGFDTYKGFHDKYGALQEWSEKNPDDWKRLEDIWRNKDQHLLAAKTTGAGADPQAVNPLVQEISELKKQFQEQVKPFLEQQKSREEQERIDKDVQAVKGEITDFQKEFSEIDLQEKDPDGIPLWSKIVQWGTSKGYVDFTSAAMVYLKPRIVEIMGLKARETAMKSVKEDQKAGIVKRSSGPILPNGAAPSKPVRSLSYAEIAEQAKSGLLAS